MPITFIRNEREVGSSAYNLEQINKQFLIENGKEYYYNRYTKPFEELSYIYTILSDGEGDPQYMCTVYRDLVQSLETMFSKFQVSVEFVGRITDCPQAAAFFSEDDELMCRVGPFIYKGTKHQYIVVEIVDRSKMPPKLSEYMENNYVHLAEQIQLVCSRYKNLVLPYTSAD